MPINYDHDHDREINYFAETNFRNTNRKFGIRTDDRRRHVYLLGKTGMGKTTLLENMVLNDIAAGHGVAYIDPHGDTAENLLDFIPANRINDVVYFNPADIEFPIGFNVLEAVDDAHRPLAASGMMGVFKKIWPDVWSARMEHILNNCILSLLEYPGSTLLGINRILVDKEYRRRVVAQIKDPVVKAFWTEEYARWEDRFRNEAIAPIQNKVGQFLSATIIRNIVAQVNSTINMRQIMDEGKIFIVNLAKGRVGEDASRLLGGMIITKLQLAAMERVDMAEADRRDFYLFVDEFQNFATQSFANILSEARKYRLNLIIAHQYIEQLDPDYVRPAVFGNVGTMVFFRVGAADAVFLAPEVAPRFVEEDLVNLTKFEIYVKLMIDGVSSEPFSAKTLPPINARTQSTDRVIKVSRERYAQPRNVIEEKILRWSGMVQDPPLVAPAASAGVPAVVAHTVPRTQPQAVAVQPVARQSAPRSAVLGSAPARRPSPNAKGPKKQVTAVCSRCQKQFSVGFTPDPSRPFYCDDCFKIVKEERAVKRAAETSLTTLKDEKPVPFQPTAGTPKPGQVVQFNDAQNTPPDTTP